MKKEKKKKDKDEKVQEKKEINLITENKNSDEDEEELQKERKREQEFAKEADKLIRQSQEILKNMDPQDVEDDLLLLKDSKEFFKVLVERTKKEAEEKEKERSIQMAEEKNVAKVEEKVEKKTVVDPIIMEKFKNLIEESKVKNKEVENLLNQMGSVMITTPEEENLSWAEKVKKFADREITWHNAIIAIGFTVVGMNIGAYLTKKGFDKLEITPTSSVYESSNISSDMGESLPPMSMPETDAI